MLPCWTHLCSWGAKGFARKAMLEEALRARSSPFLPKASKVWPAPQQSPAFVYGVEHQALRNQGQCHPVLTAPSACEVYARLTKIYRNPCVKCLRSWPPTQEASWSRWSAGPSGRAGSTHPACGLLTHCPATSPNKRLSDKMRGKKMKRTRWRKQWSQPVSSVDEEDEQETRPCCAGLFSSYLHLEENHGRSAGSTRQGDSCPWCAMLLLTCQQKSSSFGAYAKGIIQAEAACSNVLKKLNILLSNCSKIKVVWMVQKVFLMMVLFVCLFSFVTFQS